LEFGKDEVGRATLRDPDVARQIAYEDVGLTSHAVIEALNDDDEDDGERYATDGDEQLLLCPQAGSCVR
jgi:hypothetical protein